MALALVALGSIDLQAGGASGISVQQGGSTVVLSASVLNFTGDASVTGSGSTANIAITGGPGGGSTTIGLYDSSGTVNTGSGNYIGARVICPPGGFSLAALNIISFVANSTSHITPCVYAANPSSVFNASGALLASGPQVTSVGVGLVHMPLSASLALTAGNIYWLCLLLQSANTIGSTSVDNASFVGTSNTTPASTGPSMNVGSSYQIWGSNT
jgi:hypothetical protein